MAHILIIEYDSVSASRIRDGFLSSGHLVTIFKDGRSGFVFAGENPVEVIIMNLICPVWDGWQVLTKLRANKCLTPVIFLSVEDDEDIKIRAFDKGCDEFITIPFSLKELISRTNAILRRVNAFSAECSTISSGQLILNLSKGNAYWGNSFLELTPREFEILTILVTNEGNTVSRNEMLEKLWGLDTDVTTRTIDTHVQRIRKKYPNIGSHIRSEYQLGYKWILSKV